MTKLGNLSGTTECYEDNLKVVINKAGNVLTVMIQSSK